MEDRGKRRGRRHAQLKNSKVTSPPFDATNNDIKFVTCEQHVLDKLYIVIRPCIVIWSGDNGKQNSQAGAPFRYIATVLKMRTIFEAYLKDAEQLCTMAKVLRKRMDKELYANLRQMHKNQGGRMPID